MNVQRVIEMLKGLEGYREFVYDDKSPWPRSEVTRAECELRAGQYKVLVTGGTATVGYGETSADFIDRYWGRRITQDEALAKMAERVPGFYEGVRKCIDADLTEHQWEAITCRAYQTGAGGFCRSETARRLNFGDIAGALVYWRSEFAHPDRSEVEIAHFLIADRPKEEAVPRIYTRAEWGARRPNGITAAPSMNLGLGFHHLGDGWGPTGSLEDSKAKMREIQDFHMGPSRDWADYAYNWAFDHLGNIFEGRGAGVRNAANGGGSRNGWDANARWSSALYLAGTNGPALTDAAKDAAWYLMEHLGLVSAEWLGHDNFLSTACPGADRRSWLNDGHPRGTSAPSPTPEPTPIQEASEMFIYDYVPNDSPDGKPVAIIYTDGKLKWGLNSGAMLAFYATGTVPHLGSQGDEFHHALDWHPGGIDSNPGVHAVGLVDVEAGHFSLAGGIEQVMAESSFETGDPGCAG